MAKVDKINYDGTVDVILNGDLWRNLKVQVSVNKGDMVQVDNRVEIVLFRV